MRTVVVNAGGKEYSILIGAGARQRLPDLVQQRGAATRIAVVADARVAKLHLATLLECLPTPALVVTMPPGEQNKSLTQVSELYDRFAEQRISRSDFILAFGGGMTGDLAGFAAATWMRGVDFFQIPTTLLAAIDASCGGKTGVNHGGGKNLIGAFHQPAAVIADIDFLGTLPEREYCSGLAESVKHASISHADFLTWHEDHAPGILAREPGLIEELTARNCGIKAGIVALDEREAGPRMVLNHGHTIGHALEHLLEYELRHGECVALGMIVENELSCGRGLLMRDDAERIRALMTRLGLPARLPRALAPEQVLGALELDKKIRRGKGHFALLSAPGAARCFNDVSTVEIERALSAVLP